MGEAKQKSRKREEILAAELRCIYCPNPAETMEHMPPISMFQNRNRPSGLEFGACKTCNNGTRGSDAVATLFALQHPNNLDESWKTRKTRELVSTITKYAPGVMEELTISGKSHREYMRRPNSGILQPVVRVNADGPYIKAHLAAFGAKLAMGLFREYVGYALPITGAIWSQFALNAGMTQPALDARVEILPIFKTLAQGQKSVGDQFVYRYNCDGRSVLAAVVQFHRSLWFTLIASSDANIIELFNDPQLLDLPGSAMMSPGNFRA